jgi:5'-nucleotidase
LIIAEGVTAAKLTTCVKNTKTRIRAGTAELIQSLKQKNIPLLILSAGLGDIVRLFLEENNAWNSNVHIVSNFMRFDEDGNALRFIGEPITSCNKNEYTTLTNGGNNKSPIVDRSNVILLGDSLSDLKMVNPECHSTVLSIGFLNCDEDRQLEKYKSKFDVVVLHDSDMSYVNQLMDELML